MDRSKYHVWGEKRETHTEFWWGNLREENHLIDLDVDGPG